jgi:hypothetical protein
LRIVILQEGLFSESLSNVAPNIGAKTIQVSATIGQVSGAKHQRLLALGDPV